MNIVSTILDWWCCVMSLKDKLASLLRGSKADEPAPEVQGTVQAQAAQEPPSAPSFAAADPTVVQLSSDHPLQQLYQMRRKEAGSLPAPRVCIDEDGVLPEDFVRQEKARLETALRRMCSTRLKVLRGSSNNKPKPKKGEEADAKAEVKPDAVDALPWFFLSNDKIYAWVLVFPPNSEGKELSRELLLRAMDEAGISFGVDYRLIDRLSHDDSRYFNLFLLAKGKPAFDGRNGNIVDYVPRVIERVLQTDEYDQVDYTALNLIHNVEEGQELCRVIRPTEGEPGRTVLDQEIPAKSGKDVPLPKGRNTEISEDGDALIASIAGHVEFTGRSFQVKPVLDISGDVDFSTGNIKFLGDVNIQGDVLTGFTVRAMGSIWVGGVVEAGSTVEAGGDLTVVKGILGDGTTSIRSHRCVFSKYVENATICARENLQTDAIINGSIYCDGQVVVRSGRGSIIGGRIWAAQKVTATSVGAKSECRTSIALGGLPCTNFELELAKRELKDLEIEKEKLECMLDSPVKTSILAKLGMKLSAAELKVEQLEEDLRGSDEPGKKNEGRLECSTAHPGTEISFGEETVRLRQENQQCIVKMVNGEIVVM